MAYGQPFYNYGTNPYGNQNNGYVAQQPQYGNFYGQQQNASQNANNGVAQQYQGQVGQAQQQVPQMSQIPTKTNVPLATSLIDAMSRNAEFNTETFYADQDNPYIYKISIDMQGRKTYKTFKIEDVTEQTTQRSSESVASNIDLSAYATKSDVQALEEKIVAYAKILEAITSPSSIKETKTEKVDKVKE